MSEIPELRLDELNRKRVLIVWSGGLDSTSLVYRVMTETTAMVYTHFVDLDYGVPEATEAARAAVTAQRAWLQENVRDWEHSESSARIDGILHEWPNSVLRGSGAPSLLYYYTTHAAAAAIFHGFWEGDFVLSGRNSDADAPLGSRKERLLAKYKEFAIAAAYQLGPAPTFAALNPPPTRAEALAALPDELRAMLVSCPRPVADPTSPTGWRDCGKCYDCVDLTPEEHVKAALPTAVALLDAAAGMRARARRLRNGG